MLSYIFSSAKEDAFVCNGDTWFGYYGAIALVESRLFRRVYAGVCHPENQHSRNLQKRGVELREWNLNDRHSVEQAMKGMTQILITMEPSNEIKQHTQTIIEACKSAQIRQVVYWSSLGIEHANPEEFKHLHELREIEEMVRRAEFQNMCIIRLGVSQQMLFLLSHVIQNTGQLPLPTGNGRFAPVNLKDCGAATAQILASSGEEAAGHKHQCYRFTGDRLLTGQKIVECANKAIEAEIEYQNVSMDQFREILKREAEDLGEYGIECIMEKLELVKQKKLEFTTRDLEKILKRKPTNIETFFKENASSFQPSGGLICRLSLQDINATY